MGYPDAHPCGLVAAVRPRVALEGALAGRDALVHAPEEEERQPDSVVRLGGLLLVERSLKDIARGSPLRLLEEAQALGALRHRTAQRERFQLAFCATVDHIPLGCLR